MRLQVGQVVEGPSLSGHPGAWPSPTASHVGQTLADAGAAGGGGGGGSVSSDPPSLRIALSLCLMSMWAG
jgi:hypothetical protein